MRIATWNVNSLKARLEKVAWWVDRTSPDVLLLQETKLSDADAPRDEIARMGYELAHHGEGRWNGVAIASRTPITDVVVNFGEPREAPLGEARMISGVCGGVRVVCVYAPNGRSLGSTFYQQKLAWYDRLSRWLEETAAVFARAEGPVVLVGSSMGGYMALLLLRKLQHEQPAAADRIRALVLIAPAWDMTELMWRSFSSEAKRAVAEAGVYNRPSAYGDGSYPITKRFLDDGARHLIGAAAYDPGRPVHIIHGLLDPDVPWEHTLDLVAHLSGDWTRVAAVPDGEHRLSRPEDIALLLDVVGSYVAPN